MSNTTPTRYTKYNIHNKGVPTLHNIDELESYLKKLASKEYYDKSDWCKTERSGDPDPFAVKAMNTKLVKGPTSDLIEILPILKKSFPQLAFRVSGHHLYGPGDYIDEHTNSNDPSYVMYITYATGKSKFSYRFSPDEDFIDTYDRVNGITLRAFKVTRYAPFCHHKVECESGYRISIGLRYADTKN